jgi:hypothetical protein
LAQRLYGRLAQELSATPPNFFEKKRADPLDGFEICGKVRAMNNTSTVTKRGRGRPAGSTSFVNVSLADLEQFVGSASAIPVSRVWLQKQNVTITPIERSVNEVDTSESPKVQFKLTKLEE